MATQRDTDFLVHQNYELHKCCITTWIVTLERLGNKEQVPLCTAFSYLQHIQEHLGRNDESSTSFFGRSKQMDTSQLALDKA